MGVHLIVFHSAVRACPGYSRHEAPSILMDGASIARDTEHGRTVTLQLTRRHGTLGEAIDAGIFALGAAGLSKGIRRQARRACEDYFYTRLNLAPAYEPPGWKRPRTGSSCCPTRCSGPWRTSSNWSSTATTRTSAPCPASVSRSKTCAGASRTTARRRSCSRRASTTGWRRSLRRPDDEGWTFFLDLWTEDGPARLHLEGQLEESRERFTATLTDILP